MEYLKDVLTGAEEVNELDMRVGEWEITNPKASWSKGKAVVGEEIGIGHRCTARVTRFFWHKKALSVIRCPGCKQEMRLMVLITEERAKKDRREKEKEVVKV